MIRIKVIDWRGNVYKVKVMAVPTVGEDLQVGVADDRNELNDGSSFEEVNWW